MLNSEFHVRVRYTNKEGWVMDEKVRKYWYYSDAKLAMRNGKAGKPKAGYNYYIEEILL